MARKKEIARAIFQIRSPSVLLSSLRESCCFWTTLSSETILTVEKVGALSWCVRFVAGYGRRRLGSQGDTRVVHIVLFPYRRNTQRTESARVGLCAPRSSLFFFLLGFPPNSVAATILEDFTVNALGCSAGVRAGGYRVG